ncbi:hypothetical protein FDECE_2185 [Fusarium decemcellulare]|nr:hypothetical protein FDECE_2185 [Fusarium decemcellulare]
MTTQKTQESFSPIERATQRAQNRSTFYSFGDKGVTATAAASGRLLQMTRYFPDKGLKTGFCVDNPKVNRPYRVKHRLDKLLSLATDHSSRKGIDLDLDLSSACNERPSTNFHHDRWPHFTLKTTDGVKFNIKYFAFDGTIYQTYEFDFKDSSKGKSLPQLSATTDVLLRNLDFIDCESLKRKMPHNPWVSDTGGHIIRRFKADLAGEMNLDIVLIISSFSENQPLNFSKEEGGDYWKIAWNDETRDTLQSDAKVTVTIAYTLKLVPSENTLVPTPVLIQNAQDARTRPIHSNFNSPSFTDDKILDPILSRNLQHILSVCSIPLTTVKNNEIPAIALTCGDLDGHRVATAASFHCFQFMILALRHFNAQRLENPGCECEAPHEDCTSYICNMAARIQNTCKGHLKWLFKTAERSQGFFAPHHWVNGAEITDWNDNPRLPGKSLVDTPFHIIKAGDFYQIQKDMGVSTDEVKVVVEAWVKDLDKSNKLGLYAFPRCRKEPFQNFYFTDHALIWRAIRSAEQLDLQPELPAPTEADTQERLDDNRSNNGQADGDQSNDHQSNKKLRKPRSYSSSVVLKNIRKRFTTENPVSKKRMLAVSRSPAQNRFLLRAKDTALFHAMDLGLLDKTRIEKIDDPWNNMIDVWKNTLDCQALHEENDDTNWNEPLRFALSLIMAGNGRRMNLKPVEEMKMHALSVLLQSSSPNGLFPGAMDENHEPVRYDDVLMRDTYWGIAFEIPYILWKYRARPSDSMPSTEASEETSTSTKAERKPSQPTDTEFWLSLKQALEQQAGGTWTTNRFGYSMKHSFPFNNVVYQENIVELSDEWLYNEPSFFVPAQGQDGTGGGEYASDSDSTPSESDSTSDSDTTRESHAAAYVTPPAIPQNHTDAGHQGHITARWGQYMRQLLSCWPFTHKDLDTDAGTVTDTAKSAMVVGAMVDVPKFKQLRKRVPNLGDLTTEINTGEKVKEEMKKGRTPAKAKKRFWWFRSTDPSTNDICLRTLPSTASSASSSSPPPSSSTAFSEKDELSDFFERHDSHGKFFFEDTVAVLNTWSTELHLSFFTVGSRKRDGKKILTSDQKEELLSFPSPVKGQKGKLLTRAVMSFRFDGDFFDRYWTCCFLEGNPQLELDQGNIQNEVEILLEKGMKLSEADRKKVPWRQRRVLELILFDRIVSRMHEWANKILKEAKSCVQERTATDSKAGNSNELIQDELDKVDYDAFVNVSKRFQKLRKILQVVEGDLAENLAKIDLWQNREKERQGERPRWTFDNESRYRSIISKLVVLNNHSVQKLRRTHAKIANYNESLTKELEIMRSDLDQRRADDIQRFTYVTVVFLPMGFATGVFIAALIVTGILLLNAKAIESLYQRGTERVFASTGRRGLFGSGHRLLDYDDPHRPQGWRFTLTIAAEAAKEAGRVILGQMYDTFCMWIAFVMVMLIQVIPLFITLYLVQLVVPDYVNKIHWMILVIPGILLTYLMRSLFQTILNAFNRFAERQWGRAYRRRLPKWLITKNLRDTTKNLVSDFDGLICWKRYSGYEEIFLHWDPDKRSVRVDLEASWDYGPSLTFYCIGKGPDLPIISPPLAYVDDTRSEASIHRAFDWILKCTTEHEFCPKNEPKPMPDRVLDLGVSNDSPVKLVETQNRLGTYACLSHRWGSIQPLQTLKANKEAHKLGIPLEALPKTFQDAVNVCRQLSIRYLWADTLCIIQDSNDDWQRQAVEMANIYENSYLTIAATKASGHHEGLHPESEIRETHIERIPASTIGQSVSQDIYVRLDLSNRYYRNRVQHWSSIGTEQLNAHEWPLLTRAWVFQERLLSPRMLHFASRELVWECRTDVYCDCGYDHKSNDNLDFKRLVSTQSIKTSDCTPQQLRYLWYAIVERYSLVMGNLTKQTDVFPALSGLASRIAGLLGEEYAAGLWRSNIIEGLLWIPGFKMPIQGQRRPSQWVAPTWSWASVLGDVSYQYRIRSDSYNKKELQEVYASVVDVSCSSTGSQTTGAISAAVLTLSGYVMYGTIRFRTERDSVGYLGMERIYTYTSVMWNHNGDWDKFEPDHPEDIVEGQRVLCMRLARIGGQEWYIVLTEQFDGSGRFKRVGLLEGLDVTWKWFTPRSWRKRVENRYFEERREVRIV